MYDERVLEAASTELYCLLRDYQHGYVLIDPPAIPELIQLAVADLEHWPLLDPQFEEAPDLAPCLYRLTQLHADVMDQCLQQALQAATQPQRPAIGAFLFTRSEPAPLVRHLTMQMDASIERRQSLFFRYFDPRVMPHLSRILTDTQLRRLLHDIDHWCYASPLGELARLVANAPDLDTPSPMSSRTAPVLSAEQWQRLDQVEAINLTCRQLHSLEYPMTPSLWQALPDWVAQAAAAGLDANEERATYAVYGLLHGAPFATHPNKETALAMTRDSGVPLVDALTHFTGLALNAKVPLQDDFDEPTSR